LRFALPLFFALASFAAPKRVLYITYTAGFRHASIPASQQSMLEIAARSNGQLEVVPSEDLSLLTADNLKAFDAIFFFTSGELPITDQQKADLLQFVRSGKGFGGAHSATDTFYTWPDYGEMMGAYFDGHPWVQQVSIDIEDPDHPATRALAPSFQIFDEIYQFRNFSRDRVRALMTLDTRSVDMTAPGINRTDGDFALAWCRNYGLGRVFYTALGHFDSTWLDPRFQTMLSNALLWITGQIDGDAAPRSSTPVIADGGVGDALVPGRALMPGSIISIYGAGLTTGSTMQGNALKLAGTQVLLDGVPISLLYVSPQQINAWLPLNFSMESTSTLQVQVPGDGSNTVLVEH
jgi:type 1 glutamine amidotransferase